MNKETEIIEGNKLIAEFMNYDGQHEEWCGNNVLMPDKFLGTDVMIPYTPNENWADLMPVIDRIESVDGCSYKVMLQYAFAAVSDTSQHGDPYIVRAIGMTRIETAYNLVIKFIKWHNTTKQ